MKKTKLTMTTTKAEVSKTTTNRLLGIKIQSRITLTSHSQKIIVSANEDPMRNAPIKYLMVKFTTETIPPSV